jgi:hypothetical protein
MLEFVGSFRPCPGVVTRLVRSVDVAPSSPGDFSEQAGALWRDRDCKSLPLEIKTLGSG